MKIWRGDHEPSSRKLIYSIQSAESLLTNMINGGNPLALSQEGFVPSIERHSAGEEHPLGKWLTTHFLSFSKSKDVAKGFAVNKTGKSLNPSTVDDWKAFVVEIDLSKIKHVGNRDVGIDHYQYDEFTPDHKIYQHFKRPQHSEMVFRCQIGERRKIYIPKERNILTVDVYSHLKHLKDNHMKIDSSALSYSYNEQEVLVLPIDPLKYHVGNTACLDMGCLSEIDFFRLV